MENETTIETTQENYKFCDDENFNYNLEAHLKYTLEEILIDDIMKYIYYCVDYTKKMPNSHHYTFIQTYPKHKEFKRKLFENFKKYNERFIKTNINKNLRIDFYYYKYLIYAVYDLAFDTLERRFFSKLQICIKNKNLAPASLIEILNNNRKQIFKGVIETVKEKIQTAKYHNKEKYSNIPKEYKTFGEYLKKNPIISIEDINNNYSEIASYIYNPMDSLLCANLEEIFEKKEI